MAFSTIAAVGLSCALLSAASPVARQSSPYAPRQATCPSEQLVRQATGISTDESDYINQRYAKASQALETWLASIDSGFASSSGGGSGGWHEWGDSNGQEGKAPVIALTSSGGGYRAMLSGAGVIKAFDGREVNKTAVSGLYQALTYEAGLSGGSWLLSSIAGNDYPTITQLQTMLWEEGLEKSLLVPAILVSQQAAPIYSAVLADVAAKEAAGFQASIIDPWGRLLSYALLSGSDGGVQDTVSGIAEVSNFTSFNAPYPIITALGVYPDQCIPARNATQYEFHPYEFGSWDSGVDAFVDMEYLGTSFSNGQPQGNCVTHYDQLGYMFGTSSNVFAAACSAIPANKTGAATSTALVENFAALVAPNGPGVPEEEIFGLFPNPFKGFSSSSLVEGLQTLELVDGGVGVGFQGNPIWPFLHRPDVDVLIVNDNSADTTGNFPNGSEILNTYKAAANAGLTRMPEVPDVATFVSKGYDKNPTFFGCNNDSVATIIFIPNHNYTFPSGQPTSKIQYFRNETEGMISNGVVVGNYGGKENWPLCLACGIMKKSGGSLPDGCTACYDEYCYN
jgi:lysophospholipase